MMKAENTGITKRQAISLLTRSPHGELGQYLEIGRPFAAQEPEFFAHLVAWNHQKGAVRDAKVALPVIALAALAPGDIASAHFGENALAHLARLDPRNLVRAVRWAKDVKTPGAGRAIARTVERYLRERETRWPWWEATALQHRKSMKELYALYHVKPDAKADLILFKGNPPKGSAFEVVARLAEMPAAEAAGAVLEHRIPWLVAQGALGARVREPDLLLALIERMSPAELITNAAALERWGARELPETRAAFEAALERAATSKRAPALKATRAAEAQKPEAGKVAEKLRGVQERQLDAGAGVEGDWLVLADKSASMHQAIEVARQVAALLARTVRGKVHLVFFDTDPRHLEVTGRTYDEIRAATATVTADGGTSIGCGLAYARERGLEFQGIAVVSDAKENTPPVFCREYARLRDLGGEEPSVYLYRMGTTMTGYGDRDLALTCAAEGIDIQEFDLRGGVDYYSMPNIVQSMRVSRYSLLDEIMGTPLLTLDAVFRAAA